ncbi:actin family [Nitzschia inconspicua]|uniref:Actin n=1 Tax=Nitzschia inconspicua TaxID=303405 RepID=A0A9K3P951_9STRA|nr:actin [Nitzschia inconspicua]KAG7366156.1 actin family [Nitzschia inconspicua]
MAFYTSNDSVNAIVADIGSYATKIGFAGEDHPRSYFRSHVAVLREEEKQDKSNGSNSADNTKRRRRRIQTVNYDNLNYPKEGNNDGEWEGINPIDSTTGLCYDPNTNYQYNNNTDWSDLIPTFLKHGYSSALGLKATSGVPLLMMERSYNPPPIRQQMLEILMEECDVPATYFGRDATMACYACGRTTSTVIDIGYSGTTVSPVHDGFVEQKGVRRSPIGTMAMDEMAVAQLQALIKEEAKRQHKATSTAVLKPLYQVKQPKAQRKEVFRRLALLQIGKECRESGAGQAINTAASKSLLVPSIAFTLPDGQVVDVPSSTRFAVANLAVGRGPTSEDDEQSQQQQQREELYNKTKTDLEDIIKAAMQPDDEMDKKETENDDGDEEEDQSSRYNEATAVGISSSLRGTKRGRKVGRSKGKDKASTSATAATEEGNHSNQPKVRFDNRILQRACVPYMETMLEQLTAFPVANMVCDAAFRCDREQQAGVLGNVVLAGGGACIGPTDQSVPDSLREQIEAIIHTHTPGWRVKVLSPGMQERAIASWLGGSILGSLGTFHEMWITKAEYEEWGTAIVNRKCP